MATVKQTPRKRPVQAPKTRASAPRRRQASPRVLFAVAAVVVLAAVGVGVGVGLGGGGGSSKVKGTSTVNTLLRGTPQRGNTLGSPSAPVTLVEYVDMQCPYCDAFERQVLPTLVRDYVRPGNVKLIVRPLAFIGPDSARGRNAIVAAGRQDRFFHLMELLYLNQGAENSGWLSEGMVERAAKAVGLDVTRFNADRTSSSATTTASGFDALATRQGVHSTPSIFVGRTGGTLTGVRLRSPTDVASVASAIQQAGY